MRNPAPLSGSQWRELALAPPSVQQLVTRLTASEAATRAVGLQAVVSELVDASGAPTANAAVAVPFLIALATHPRYPGAAALLLGLGHVMVAIDTPPRSRAGARGTHDERDLYDRIEQGAPAFIRCAQKSRDPQASRLSACLAGRFPSFDAEVEPLLIALLSGASDPDVACRLLYVLARIQVSRGAPLSNRVAEALSLPPDDVRGLAVNLALAEHALDPPTKRRVAEALRFALDAPDRFADPRAFGRILPASTLREALAALAK